MLDPSAVALEVLEDRKMLEDLVGYPVRGMAYPFGTYSPRVIEILKSLGVVYSRTVERRDPCFPPSEPLAWPATAHMFTKEPDDVGVRFKKMHDNPRAGGVYFVWGHSYEFARPTDRWAEMETLFAPLAGHADVWYCTNIELFDYEADRDRGQQEVGVQPERDRGDVGGRWQGGRCSARESRLTDRLGAKKRRRKGDAFSGILSSSPLSNFAFNSVRR
jgi:hypothetical protein